jgi:hypothetical protein
MDTGLVAVMRGRKEFFPKTMGPGPRVRAVVEGGYQHDWKAIHVDGEQFDIPQGVTFVSIDRYQLGLVAQMDQRGEIVPVDAYDRAERKVTADYDTFFRIQHPTTIVTEDGRIFFDTELSDAGKTRLPRFLAWLLENHESFGSAYLDAIQNRGN